MKTELIIFLAFALIGFYAFMHFVPVNLWITAVFSGLKIDLSQLIFMRIRKSPVTTIVNCLITLNKAGVKMDMNTLETHALAGGDIERLTKALIKVNSLSLSISLDELKAQDLAGNDLTKYVERRNEGIASGIDEIKQKICAKVWEELTDDQVRDIEKYMSAYK